MNDALATMTEADMRAHEVPGFDTIDELVAYLRALEDREHDYGTAAYAVSLAATAAFRYMARKQGITGFQASCADMDVIRRTRRLAGPFMLINGEKALYPQYDLPAQLTEFLADIRPWLAEKAAQKLAEAGECAPRVRDHWLALAATPQAQPA